MLILNDFTDVETNEDIAYAFYNLAIGSLYIGQYALVIHYCSKALQYIKNDFRYQIKLLMSFPLIFMNEIETANHTLDEVITHFEKVHDLPNLHTAFYVLFYLSRSHENNVSESVKTYFRMFEHDDRFLEGKDIQEVSYRVKLLHIAIGYSIATHQSQEAEPLIRGCLSITSTFPALRELHATTYFLASKIETNKLHQKKYLKMALDYLGDVETVLKAIVLYELGCLEEEGPSYFRQSSQIFYENSTSNLNSVNELLKNHIPMPRY